MVLLGGMAKDWRRQVAEFDPDRGARHHPGQELSLGADVEQARAKWQRYRNAGGDERDDVDDRGRHLQGGVLALRAGDAKTPAQQSRVSVERVAAGDGHDHGADDEREDDRAEGHRQTAGQAPGDGRHAWGSRTGALGARPRISGYAGMSAGGGSVPSWVCFLALFSSAFSPAGGVRVFSAAPAPP